jgi:hypothetical protein
MKNITATKYYIFLPAFVKSGNSLGESSVRSVRKAIAKLSNLN